MLRSKDNYDLTFQNNVVISLKKKICKIFFMPEIFLKKEKKQEKNSL